MQHVFQQFLETFSGTRMCMFSTTMKTCWSWTNCTFQCWQHLKYSPVTTRCEFLIGCVLDRYSHLFLILLASADMNVNMLFKCTVEPWHTSLFVFHLRKNDIRLSKTTLFVNNMHVNIKKKELSKKALALFYFILQGWFGGSLHVFFFHRQWVHFIFEVISPYILILDKEKRTTRDCHMIVINRFLYLHSYFLHMSKLLKQVRNQQFLQF